MSDFTPNLFGRLWRDYMKRHLFWMLVATFCMIIQGGSVGALSYMLQPMFDIVFIGERHDMVIWVGLAIFGLFLLRAIVGIFQSIIMANIGFRITSKIQMDLVDHTMKLSSGFFSRHAPGELIERVQGDVAILQTAWRTILIGAGRDVIALISLAVVAVSIDPLWTLVAIVGTPIALAPSLLVQRYIRRKSQQLRSVAAQRTAQLDEIFHGITSVKLNTLEDYQNHRFSNLTEKQINQNIKIQAGSAFVPGLVDFAVGLGFWPSCFTAAGRSSMAKKQLDNLCRFSQRWRLPFNR